MEDFESTSIWKRTFAAVENDSHRDDKDRLRLAFLRLRERVKWLVGFISKDIPHLTVHDISHLDALWEIANIIAGEDYPLNPAEAFVFGSSVLLHDAAMCLAAYPNGINDLKTTPQWRDNVATLLSIGGKVPSNKEIESPSPDIIRSALEETLRLLHAKRARELLTQEWTSPDGTHYYLMEDSELRMYYGPLIGQISESHWWDVNSLPQLQPAWLTAFAGFPTDWTVDPIKGERQEVGGRFMIN